MPRAAPSSVQEHRITFGTYERDMLPKLVGKSEDDIDVKMLVDVGTALITPAMIGLGAYMLYVGMVNFGTGVDELKNRFNATPAGRYANRFADNTRRFNPVYRFFNWSLGGENPPIIDPSVIDKAASMGEKVKAAVDKAIPDDIPTPGAANPTPGATNADGSRASGGGGRYGDQSGRGGGGGF